jgi:hypothetical protein
MKTLAKIAIKLIPLTGLRVWRISLNKSTILYITNNKNQNRFNNAKLLRYLRKRIFFPIILKVRLQAIDWNKTYTTYDINTNRAAYIVNDFQNTIAFPPNKAPIT